MTFHKELLNYVKRYVVLSHRFDLQKPKLHLWMHCTARSLELGNPWFYQCFEDESQNKVLKKVLENVSQQTFEAVALSKMDKVLDKSHKRRKV